MHIAVDDYLMVEGPNDKPQLAKAMAVKQGMVRVRLEKNSHIPSLRQIIDVEQRGVILNLGKKPHKGTVYGVPLGELYTRTVQHPIVGDVHFFYKPEKEAAQSLWRSFNMVHTKLKKNGLARLIEDEISWEVYGGDGNHKYSGMYYPSRKEGEAPRIKFRPESRVVTEYPYVILHELGHHLHFHYCSDNDQLNGAWVKLYNRSVKVKPVGAQECRAMCRAFEGAGSSVNAFKRELQDDDAKKNFAKILAYIKANHNLTPTEINILIASNNWKEVEACWPTQVTSKDLDPIISDYANKNVRETFAEAFSLHFCGTQFPSYVTGLLDKTINYAKSQFGG